MNPEQPTLTQRVMQDSNTGGWTTKAVALELATELERVRASKPDIGCIENLAQQIVKTLMPSEREPFSFVKEVEQILVQDVSDWKAWGTYQENLRKQQIETSQGNHQAMVERITEIAKERDDLRRQLEELKHERNKAGMEARKDLLPKLHQLRAENTLLKSQNDSFDRELTRRDAENAELRKDKERLDWLEYNRQMKGQTWFQDSDDIRQAIDAAKGK